MRYRFSELVDIQSVRKLLLGFYKATNVCSALYEVDGTKLATSGWASICINFHRRDPRTRRRCVESDTTLVNNMIYGKKYAIYRCKNGLMDAVAPVMVGGEHVANVFSGQVLFEEPDLVWFQEQIEAFGFDRTQYLKALAAVPVLQRDKLEPALEYLSRFAELLGELGLRHLRQLEAEDALLESESKYRNIFENAMEGVFQVGPDGRFLEVNPALALMHGFDSPARMMIEIPSAAAYLFIDLKDRQRFFRQLKEHGFVKAFEVQTCKNDGEKIWISMNARAIRDESGKIVYEGIAENVSERKRAEMEMKSSQGRLEVLSRTLLTKMEIERHHIAYELHDEIGQALTAVKMNLESMRCVTDPGELNGCVDESIGVIQKAMEQVRNLSLNLRPAMLDDLGLTAALRWLVNSMTKKREMEVNFYAEATKKRLSKEIETACFRVAQEAVTNVLKHAQASRIGVDLRKEKGGLRLTVSDDGVGFDVGAAQTRCINGGSFGLLGMEERVALSGGTFLVQSARGKGSRVMARFPLKGGRNGIDTAAHR